MAPALLFVYGTLRRGSNNKFARLLHAHAQLTGSARMRGRLFSLGSYPGVVSSSREGEWVRGELYSIHDPRWILPALDSYEGPEQFERVRVDVLLDSGDHVPAWVYVYRGAQGGKWIRSGDWLRR